eukprot:2134407-Prymnesium_polylepis.2
MDRYQKVKQIGKGAFGAAILVRPLGDPRQQLVIKEVDVSGLNQRAREEAKNEIKLLSSFHHPNIVTYKESFLEHGKLHIVMEYAEGGDLNALLKSRNGQLLPEEQVLDYFVQVEPCPGRHPRARPASIHLLSSGPGSVFAG